MNVNAERSAPNSNDLAEDELSIDELESVAGGLLLPAVQKAREASVIEQTAEGTPVYLKFMAR